MSTALAINNSIEIWNDETKLKEIRKIVCPTPLTDVEFSFLVELGRATQLNPFMREIWAVKYKQGVAASIFIGRDGYRKAAQRHHDYDYHQVNAVYSNDDFKVVNDQIAHSYGLTDRGDLIGAYCIVKRKSAEKYSYTLITMSEYDLSQGLWKTKPETMIKKVAEAQGLRQTFQDILGGTYSDAEFRDNAKPSLHVIKGETQTEKLNSLLSENVINAETGEVIDEPAQSFVEGNPDIQISEEQMQKIQNLFDEKQLSESRINKAFSLYKIERLEQLTDAQARRFIFQLEKV